jgi:hypothetical protein
MPQLEFSADELSLIKSSLENTIEICAEESVTVQKNKDIDVRTETREAVADYYAKKEELLHDMINKIDGAISAMP